MKFFTKFLKRKCDQNNEKLTKLKFIIIERIKPWIVLTCLEKENYIITDNKAEEIAITIVNQAITLNVFSKVTKKIGLT